MWSGWLQPHTTTATSQLDLVTANTNNISYKCRFTAKHLKKTEWQVVLITGSNIPTPAPTDMVGLPVWLPCTSLTHLSHSFTSCNNTPPYVTAPAMWHRDFPSRWSTDWWPFAFYLSRMKLRNGWSPGNLRLYMRYGSTPLIGLRFDFSFYNWTSCSHPHDPIITAITALQREPEP